MEHDKLEKKLEDLREKKKRLEDKNHWLKDELNQKEFIEKVELEVIDEKIKKLNSKVAELKYGE